MKPKSTQHVDRDYFDQYGQRRFCNLSMSVAARRPAVQTFHPTARCSCGRRMLWMCPRHIFHIIYFPYLSFHLQESASVKGFWLHFSTCGRGTHPESLLCRCLPSLAAFTKPIPVIFMNEGHVAAPDYIFENEVPQIPRDMMRYESLALIQGKTLQADFGDSHDFT